MISCSLRLLLPNHHHHHDQFLWLISPSLFFFWVCTGLRLFFLSFFQLPLFWYDLDRMNHKQRCSCLVGEFLGRPHFRIGKKRFWMMNFVFIISQRSSESTAMTRQNLTKSISCQFPEHHLPMCPSKLRFVFLFVERQTKSLHCMCAHAEDYLNFSRVMLPVYLTAEPESTSSLNKPYLVSIHLRYITFDFSLLVHLLHEPLLEQRTVVAAWGQGQRWRYDRKCISVCGGVL